jgi:hypothetical protein
MLAVAALLVSAIVIPSRKSHQIELLNNKNKRGAAAKFLGSYYIDPVWRDDASIVKFRDAGLLLFMSFEALSHLFFAAAIIGVTRLIRQASAIFLRQATRQAADNHAGLL